MEKKNRIARWSAEIISYLFVLLFIYAAASKLLAFNHFRIQLGKSPIISSYAHVIAWLVPALEVLLGLLLCFARTRFLALVGSLNLVIMFTAYIVIILNWSSFIPCSCGGILSEMGWTEHLIFNVVFIVLAVAGLLLQAFQYGHARELGKMVLASTRKHLLVLVTFSLFLSSLSMVGLFLLSEHSAHRNNGFIRSYPHSPASMIRGWKLPFNSYYLAGIAERDIFLGNVVAPSHLLKVTMDRKDFKSVELKIEGGGNLAFTAPRIEVHAPYFFIYDGNVPAIFRGLTSDWKGYPYWTGATKFLQLQPVDDDTLLVCGLYQNQSNIGIIGKGGPAFPVMPQLLERQTPEVFDTDGMLLYSQAFGRLVYVYYYRNKYVVSDLDQTQHYQGSTIDTIANPVMEVAYDDAGRSRTLAQPPVFVQLEACTSGRYLFVKSNRLGRYESEEMLEQASIIDVYNLEEKTYEFSFYLYDYEGERIKSFRVHGDKLVGLTETYLVLYKLQQSRFDFSPLSRE